MNPFRLSHVHVAGFRSLRDVAVELGDVTVLIGPNGAGKSNLLSALRLVPLLRTQSLRRFVGEQGGASSLLHYGAGTTREMTLRLTFTRDQRENDYRARLGYAAGDALLFLDEEVSTRRSGFHGIVMPLGAGHSESQLSQTAKQRSRSTARVVDGLVARINFFHFHDTSLTSPLRQNSRAADNRYLRSDGSNLAAFLYRLKVSDTEGTQQSWNLINGLVRRVAPFIKSLEPDWVDPDRPEQSAVRLYWVDEHDYRFDTHDLSDGTLRAIALITALAQPSASLPQFIIIDEPELGLHPAAVSLFVSLVRSVSTRSQVLLATQSPAMLDGFEPDEVVVVERKQGETSFKRLVPAELVAWLEEYSLSELYDKNVLGGRP